MKKLIDKLKKMTNGVDNLSEKQDFYEDVEKEEVEKVDGFKEIIDDLSTKFSYVEFKDNEDEGAHPFLKCSENLSKAIGIDNITLCPYKGSPHSLLLFSNYMWMCADEKESNTLFIDVYDTDWMDKEDIRDFIEQELYNFKRDAEWVVEGKYNEEMEKMKKNL